MLQLFQHFFVGKYSVADPFMCTLYLRMRMPGLRNFVNYILYDIVRSTL